MNLFIVVITLFLSCSNLQAFSNSLNKQFEQIELKIGNRDFKEALDEYTCLISKHPEKRSEILLKQAVCYVKDQELERGLTTFLEAIECAPKKRNHLPPSKQYKKALGIYLSQSEESPSKVAKKIQEDFLGDFKKEADLGFILAASSALLGDYPGFMTMFYLSYLKDSEHYMVDRTFGMVYLKLAKFSNSSDEKNKLREQAFVAFQAALRKNSKDAILFRLTLLLGDQSQKSNLLKENLNIILQEDTMLARVDLFPYVLEALVCGYEDLAEQLIEKARVYYPVSRSLDATQKYFEEYQTKITEKGIL